jgi:hypothetical protein
VDAKIDTQIGGLRSEMTAQIGGLRHETGARFDRVNTRIDEVHTKLDAKIDSKFHQLVGILLVLLC